MNDCEILFKRLKDVALRDPHRSGDFQKFVKMLNNTPHYHFHHTFGSLGSLKSTDLLGTAEEGERHLKGELERAWIISRLPTSISNLLQYTIHLENICKKNKWRII